MSPNHNIEKKYAGELSVYGSLSFMYDQEICESL